MKPIDPKLYNLSNEIKALSPPDKLRLAADLLEKQRADLAHTIARGVVEELGAALAIRSLERRASHQSGTDPGKEQP